MRLALLLLFFYFSSFEILAENKLRFVTEKLPPYQVVKDNKVISGTSYKLINKAQLLANLNTEIEVFPWARAYQIALSIPNVILFSVARTEQREDKFLWLFKLQPLIYRYYSSKKRAVNESFIKDNQQDVRVAAVRGSYEEDSLIKQGFLHQKNLILTKDYDTMWSLLDQGVVDITYASHIPESALKKSKHGFKPHNAIIDKYDLYIVASRNSDPELLQKFTSALQQANRLIESNKGLD